MNTKKTVAKEKQYEIVSGPCKDALFDACKYAYDKHSRVSIWFSIPVGYTMPPENADAAYVLMKIKNIRLCMIEHEDGSGESFNLHGYCVADLSPVGAKDAYKPYRFKTYYNARTRKGTITFVEW